VTRLYRFFTVAALAFLTACSQQLAQSTQTQSPTPIPGEWSITAKLGIRTKNNSGSLTVQWHQNGNQYTIRVSGPLGQGNGKISGNPQAILIERPNHPTIYSTDPEQLLQDTFQWALPVQHMGYWVRGLPSPLLDKAEYEHMDTGVLKRMEQSGWQLQYDRYRQTDAWLMPGRIKAKRDDLHLTLIIRQWRFPL
jgi:outer membrane lipoprotein LolB